MRIVHEFLELIGILALVLSLLMMRYSMKSADSAARHECAYGLWMVFLAIVGGGGALLTLGLLIYMAQHAFASAGIDPMGWPSLILIPGVLVLVGAGMKAVEMLDRRFRF